MRTTRPVPLYSERDIVREFIRQCERARDDGYTRTEGARLARRRAAKRLFTRHYQRNTAFFMRQYDSDLLKNLTFNGQGQLVVPRGYGFD